jgi:hypothetical protein
MKSITSLAPKTEHKKIPLYPPFKKGEVTSILPDERREAQGDPESGEKGRVLVISIF